MKKIKMFMGAVLCMNLLTLSGCDRIVQSAVVEEKDQTEQKKEEKKETVQKTVAEQVQAPETYQTTIQADLRSADREDKETPMNFTLTADAPVKVPDVDAICLKKIKRVAIPEEEQNKIKDTFGKGQPMQEEKNENEQAGTYTVDGLTYRYSYTQSEQVSDVEELGFQIAKFSFDDCGDMTLASSEKKEREERFQNYIKAGSGKVSEKEAKEKVSGLVSGDWEIFESSSKALTEGSTTLEKDDKLQAKDLINLGLFTVLYFVIGCCVAIPVGFVPIFLPILGALWSLITGIPFMLFLTRVKKFGMVTIMGILSGLLMGLTGMGFWGVPMGVIFGLLGDLILKSGGYKSAKKSLIGYAVFSLWMVGTYIPMYFMVEDSWASFAASFGEEYADRVMAVMPMWSIILVIAGIFIFAILGGLLGKALLKKHFAKAGIV